MSEDDRVFLNEGAILISKTRFVVGAQTYAMAGISSVRGIEMAPNWGSPSLIILLGMLIALIGAGSMYPDARWWGGFLCLIGVGSIAAGVVTLCRQKPAFIVILTTAGGEEIAYSSPDAHLIERILNALNEAIIARG